jgi:tol-pal system protein YbgF
VSFRRYSWLAPLAATLTAGCFATRNDVRLLKADIERLHAQSDSARVADAARMRAEQARRDSMMAADNRRRDDAARHLMDSVRAFAEDFSRFRASQAVAMSELQNQVATVQEMSGMSARQMSDLRARIDAQREANSSRVTGDSGVAEGPRIIYQAGIDQLGKGAYGQARGAFQDIIDRYPTDTLAIDAMYQLGVALNAEKKDVEADSVWTALVRKYPKSDRAAGALYKRGVLNEDAGRTAEARRIYQQLIKDYPSSDEARHARERLAKLPRG